MTATAAISREDAKSKLPNVWPLVKLAKVCDVVMGQSPEGTSYNTHGEGEPLLNGPTEFGEKYPTAVQWTTSPTRFCQAGDILLCVRGATTGRRNLADRRYCIGRGLAAIRGKLDQADTEFLSFALDLATEQILREASGSTFPNIPGEKLEQIKIPLPPLAEQKRIAGILKEQMAAVERACASAEAQLQSAEHLPTAYLRAVFDNGESKSWPKKRLGDIAKTSSGSTPSRGRSDYFGGTIPWVKTGELRDGFILDTEEKVTEKALKECSLPLLPAQTVLVAMYGQGQTRGRTGLLTQPMTTNQACFAVLPNPKVFDSAFLQWWFRHSYARLRQETENRGGNQPNLNGIFLREQEVQLPPLTDQRRIAAQLSSQMASAERLRQMLSDQLDAINKLPAALLREAFSGRI